MRSKLWIGIMAVGTLLAAEAFGARYIAYVGTYTRTGKGIYAFRFDSGTGAVQLLGLMAETPNPSFLAVHPNGRFLYAVNEHDSGTAPSGTITSYAMDTKTGALTRLNSAPSGGLGPCHLVVDKTGKTLLVANYGSGSVATLRILPDGRLGDTPVVDQHKGSSVVLPRQAGPHGHGVVLSADNKFLFSPDLGLDQVLSYKLDAAKGTLVPNDPPFTKVAGGNGPRHFAMHPNGKFAYLNNEISSSATAFAYDRVHGTLKELHTITTLPADFSGQSATAEIAVDAKGRFLYVSNRGHNSIATFAIGADGKLTPAGHTPTGGKTPRNFQIDPSGAYLFAANQESASVVEFRIDAKTGLPSATGKTLEIPEPVCIVFVAAK